MRELERARGARDCALEPVHATRRLVDLGLLVFRPQEGLRFRNELVREVVVRALPEAERPGVELSPSESVLLALVELATRPCSELEWQALQARSREHSVEQEPLEVLELQALARLRQGEQQVAVRLLGQALRRAEHLPNIMRPRLERRLRLARGG